MNEHWSSQIRILRLSCGLFPVSRRVHDATENGKREREQGQKQKKGLTFFDTGIVLQLIALGAVTQQVPRREDTAGHSLWTPAAFAVVGLGQAQKTAWTGHAGVASWRGDSQPQHGG